jgi:hypothetical protein
LISTRTLKNTNAITTQTSTWNRKGRNTDKLILWNQNYTHPKTRQGKNKQTKKKNYRSISLMNLYAKILNKNITHHDEVSFILGMQGYFNICKSLNVI